MQIDGGGASNAGWRNTKSGDGSSDQLRVVIDGDTERALAPCCLPTPQCESGAGTNQGLFRDTG